jgi:hypothetical protein
MNMLDTVMLQMTELHPASMQLVQAVIIRAQNVSISIPSAFLSEPEV